MAVTFLTNEDEKRILDEANAGKLLIAPQELTEEEKEQARNNIGAVSADEHAALIGVVQTTAQDLDRVSEVVEDTLGSRLANGSVTLVDREGSKETLFLDHDKLHMTVRDKAEVVLTAGYHELTSEQMDAARYNIGAASVEDVTKRTEYDNFVDDDITSTLTIEDGYYYGKNLTKLEQKGLACTNLIPVKSGDKFKISSVYGYYSPLVAEFDSTKTMVSYTAQIDGTDVPVTDYEYTVPSGISYIAINSRYQQTKPLVVKKVVVDSVKHRIAKLEKGGTGTGGGNVDIPTTLPNPHPLRLTGAVNAEYDGSKEVEVEIPAEGGVEPEWEEVVTHTIEAETTTWSYTFEETDEILVTANGLKCNISNKSIDMCVNDNGLSAGERCVTTGNKLHTDAGTQMYAHAKAIDDGLFKFEHYEYGGAAACAWNGGTGFHRVNSTTRKISKFFIAATGYASNKLTAGTITIKRRVN